MEIISSKKQTPASAVTSNQQIANVTEAPAEAIRRGFDAISRIQNEADGNDVAAVADGKLQTQPKSSIEWIAVTELGYTYGGCDTQACSSSANSCSANSSSELIKGFICFNCGKHEASTPTKTLLKCSQCRVASYCSKSCQVTDWRGKTGLGHKHSCAAYKRVGQQMILQNEHDKRIVREQVVTKVRFYASPYAVHNMFSEGIGKGILFLQSECTLAQLSLPTAVMCNGQALQQSRSVLLHYLTLGEYDLELCRDDFELALFRNEVRQALDRYDKETQVVYMMRFRCGHLALAIAPLVPDYGLCKALAMEYYAQQGSQAIQLNLDDI